VIPAKGENDGFREYLDCLDAGRCSGKRSAQYPDIDQATAELVELLTNAQFNDFDGDVWKSSMELIHHRRQLPRVERRAGVGDTNPSELTPSGSFHDLLRALSLRQRQFGLAQKQLARLAEYDGSARALGGSELERRLLRVRGTSGLAGPPCRR